MALSQTNAVYGKIEHDNYIIQSNTKNISFIRLFSKLKANGVVNNKFFLRLYDPDLLHVDPHSKNLTDKEKDKILYEIRRNPYYYLREVVRIPIPGGSQRFELHRGNLALTWAIFNNLDLIVLLPRQRYKTVSIVSALSWIYNFATSNTHMIFGNKSLGDAKNNLTRFKDIVKYLPNFIKTALTDDKDTNNIEFIRSENTNNKIQILGQPISEVDADKAGRGCSIPIFWSDE